MGRGVPVGQSVHQTRTSAQSRVFYKSQRNPLK